MGSEGSLIQLLIEDWTSVLILVLWALPASLSVTTIVAAESSDERDTGLVHHRHQARVGTTRFIVGTDSKAESGARQGP